jgi:hypothetical protein
MDKSREQPERDTTATNHSQVLSTQSPTRGDDSPYEEIHIPYLPLPGTNSQQTNTFSRSKDGREAVPPSEPKSGMNDGGILFVIILGALVGWALSAVTGGSPLLWGGIGAVGGAVLALFSTFFSDGRWLFFIDPGSLDVDLSELFHCCSISAIFIITIVITIGVLLLRLV